MGLRFIIGRAGTGKSTLCINEIIEQQENTAKRQILIVPEQFTSQAERDLVSQSRKNALMTAEVLSFGRLAHRVFSKKGIGSRIPLGDIGKSMALRKILLQEKEQLSYFRSVAEKPGFVDQLGLTISEFFQYCITPEQAQTFAKQEGLSVSAKQKLADLTHIYRAYLDFLQQEYISADETLSLLAQRLDDTLGFSDTEFWLDGFYGFTPQEYAILRRLLQLSAQVTVTLPMDENTFKSSTQPPYAPFYEPNRTKQKLMELTEELGLPPASYVILKENKRASTKALSNLEENYFYRFYKKCSLNESIHIFSCPTQQDEIRFAAGKILRLVREEGIRYRDIAIVTNAMELYEKNLRGILAEYHIPCFVDARRQTGTHPLVTTLTALLEILVFDFRYDAIFSYLKAGLTPLTTEEIDILENYVLAYGIKGYKWKKEYWDYGMAKEGAEAIEVINELRAQLMAYFAPLLSISKTKPFSFHDFLVLLTEHLETLRAAETLECWAKEAAESGNLQKADEYRQIWQLVLDVLQKADDLLGRELLTLPEMAKILQAGLEKCTMGVIPPTADCLLIGDIERSRLPQIRYLFVLGVNEGILPSPRTAQGIFTDAERQLLTAQGMELANSSKQAIFEEQFLLYQGLAKPSHGLWLTFANSNQEGHALLPSPFIDSLCRMDTGLKPEQMPAFDLQETAPEAAFHLLGEQMLSHTRENPMSPLWQDIYQFFAQQETWQHRLSLLKKGIGQIRSTPRLSPKIAKKLYAENILSSVSRLERFASCPFSFFAEYGLQAEERRLYQLQTPDLGILFHEVLERFSHNIEKQQLHWQELTKEQTRTLIEQAVDEAAPQLGNHILLDSAANQYLVHRLKRISTRAAWTLVRHLQHGKFMPAEYEAGFGIQEKLPPILIELSEGGKLILNGKIDRIDLFDTAGNHYVKIIDYKSGNKNFQFQDVYYGLQLQLLLYMDAYLKHQKKTGDSWKPGGAFYFRISDPLLKLEAEASAEQIETELYQQLQMSGLLLDDAIVIAALDESLLPEGTTAPTGKSQIIPLAYTKAGTPTAASSLATEKQYEALLSFVTRRAREIGDSMKAGVIAPSPYRTKETSPCDYCRFRSICRHTYEKTPQFRNLKKVDKKNFWDLLEEETTDI